jgi:hypothetical protein
MRTPEEKKKAQQEAFKRWYLGPKGQAYLQKKKEERRKTEQGGNGTNEQTPS